MNVLLIGSGGREHALAVALAKSPLLSNLYASPGNPGIAQLADCAALADHAAILRFVKDKDITFVVIGPEAPLVAGLADDLEKAGIACFGPSRAASQLEGSKGFTKDLCARYAIPTAAYRRFSSLAPALAYARQQTVPIVIKADGLAAGKGVTVALSLTDAEAALAMIFQDPQGACVIEEFLDGEEASFFVLSDGLHLVPLATAQDHKRLGDGDTGPNTGGMGAYSPAPCMTPELCAAALDQIVRPTIAAMADMGHPFRGLLYAGLMLTSEGPKLIEYNVRFGDPEAEVILPRLASDLLPLLLATNNGTLAEQKPVWRPEAALTVVMAAKGYPDKPVKGILIKGIDKDFGKDVQVYQAGTSEKDGQIISSGGRVLAVTALGSSISEAQMKAYDAIKHIDFPGSQFRRDIGWRAIARPAFEDNVP